MYLLYAEGSGTCPELRGDVFEYAIASSTCTPKLFEVAVELGEAALRRFPDAAVHNDRPLLYALLTHFKAAIGTVGNKELLENPEQYFWLLGR